MSGDGLHKALVRLRPQQSPPSHYYADNLLIVVDTVLERYGDMLQPSERQFGMCIRALSKDAQRLFARLAGRASLLREDRLNYAEVADLEAALAELEARARIDRSPASACADILRLLTMDELRRTFREVQPRLLRKGDYIQRVINASPPRFCRWRIRRVCRWLALRDIEYLQLYRLLFFGDRRQDLTTFVMRDLGVHRFEAVPLCKETRQFADRATLDRFLELLRTQDRIADLGARPDLRRDGSEIAALIEGLWQRSANRLLERRRSRALNRLGRNLERVGEFDMALACYGRSTLTPARERRMRILRRLGDDAGVAALRGEIARAPQTALEADFANRFGLLSRRPALPILDKELTCELPPTTAIEEHALHVLTADGGIGWHLENNMPMALFALAYWRWLFAPVRGAFVNGFQTGPIDLFWPDFFKAREHLGPDPLATELKPRLRTVVRAKNGIANRLFNWRRFTPAVAEAVIDGIPEDDLRALVTIVREDLAGRRAGFPDLVVLYGGGRYEFVEVKGPGDRLQIHQRLWIEALQRHGLPVRVLRFRR